MLTARNFFALPRAAGCRSFAALLWLAGLPVLPVLMASASPALAQTSNDNGNGYVDSAKAAGPAFELQIHATDTIRALLQQHLELLRYQSLPDLGDTEVQRLLLSAEQDARELLATLGYFSPQIRFTQSPSAPDGRVRLIDLDVQPGPQARIASVHIVIGGALAQDPDGAQRQQALQDEWQLPVDSAFTQRGWDEAKRHALAQLLAQRYAAARLVESQAEVQPDKATVALTLQFDSGPAYRLGALQVQGDQRYPQALVHQLARLHAGDDYRAVQLVEAQQRLSDSGYYDSAYLRLDLDSDPQAATVLAQVREASTQKLVFGLGASTDSGVRVSAEHIHQQVPGIGWRADNKISADRLNRSFASDWTSPPSDGPWRWATSLLVTQQDISETEVTAQQYRVGRFTTADQLDESYYVQFAHSTTVVNLTGVATPSESVTGNYAFTLRRLDSLPFPSRGWALGGEFGAGSTLGSGQEPYGRVLMRIRNYQPLGARAGRLVLNGQAGAVVVNDVASVPFTQLFLAGGDNSVRGYKVGDIGVSGAAQSTPVPGRYLFAGSVEWQRPIYNGALMTDWESTLFLDSAAVANDPTQLTYQYGVGAGARWKSPIGPLQIDLAYGVATQRYSLHLGLGFVF